MNSNHNTERMPELFSDLFSDGAFSDTVAVYDGDIPYSFGEINTCILKFASRLMDMGVKPGDHVGLYAPNNIRWIIAFFAIVRIGGVAVLLNSRIAPEFVSGCVKDTDVGFLIYEFPPNRAWEEQFRRIFIGQFGFEGKCFDLQEADFASMTLPKECDLPAERKNEDQTDVIFFSSGTTARPKAVMYSQRAVISNAWYNYLSQPKIVQFSWFLALPFFHSFGMTALIIPLFAHIPLFFSSTMTPESIISTIERYKIFCLFTTSCYGFKILQHEAFGRRASDHLRICVFGGEFADRNALLALAEKYPKLAICVGYGQTEVGPVVSVVSPDDDLWHRVYTVGKPLKETKIRIINDDSGEESKSAGSGEICVSNNRLMNGYYHEPEDRQPKDEDGYIHTGDIGFLDNDGYLHLSGRKRDIIIVNGENISVAEIEETLRRLPQIRDLCVFGMSKDKSKEEIICCFTLKDGRQFDEGEFRLQAQKLLPTIKIPHHFICLKELSLADNGAVDKAKVMEIVKNLII